MIKQDYLIRMIQEIVTLIVNAILNKKKIRKQEWVEYDSLTEQILGFPTLQLTVLTPDELIARYEGDLNQMGKIELAATTMLKLSDEMEPEEILLKAKLRQEGIGLLKYVQEKGNNYSLQRKQLIDMLELSNNL
jgi:hypothetical protein